MLYDKIRQGNLQRFFMQPIVVLSPCSLASSASRFEGPPHDVAQSTRHALPQLPMQLQELEVSPLGFSEVRGFPEERILPIPFSASSVGGAMRAAVVSGKGQWPCRDGADTRTACSWRC
jgi:hypothetical protein